MTSRCIPIVFTSYCYAKLKTADAKSAEGSDIRGYEAINTISKSKPQLPKRETDNYKHATTTIEALAKDAVEENRFVFVPHLKSFMVGTKDQKCAVTLYPKETCQCPSVRTCYHILDAKLLMGIPLVYGKAVLNLTELRKLRHGTRRKASGRKKPRQGDYKVQPAPDLQQGAGWRVLFSELGVKLNNTNAGLR